jgi:hypothetical protein
VQLSLQEAWRQPAWGSHFLSTDADTHRRSPHSVRSATYLANTCSRQRGHQPLRSARSVPLSSPARSCCSRTTTTSTGRSTRTSGTNQSIRTGRSCAIARECGAPAPPRLRPKRACRRSSTPPGARPRQSDPPLPVRPPATHALLGRRNDDLRPDGRPLTPLHAAVGAASRAAPPRMKNRRRPTLPGPCEPSTIGAEGLNCSVRNGKRCFPLAKATGKRRETSPPGPSKLHSATAGITKKSVKPSTH